MPHPARLAGAGGRRRRLRRASPGPGILAGSAGVREAAAFQPHSQRGRCARTASTRRGRPLPRCPAAACLRARTAHRGRAGRDDPCGPGSALPRLRPRPEDRIDRRAVRHQRNRGDMVRPRADDDAHPRQLPIRDGGGERRSAAAYGALARSDRRIVHCAGPTRLARRRRDEAAQPDRLSARDRRRKPRRHHPPPPGRRSDSDLRRAVYDPDGRNAAGRNHDRRLHPPDGYRLGAMFLTQLYLPNKFGGMANVQVEELPMLAAAVIPPAAACAADARAS
ncbi:MAG: hypothetical protein MZV64_16995 [Ignavibacteriales bacterium]|nr:hypothetical protein [Ignavibacteriales bacterium]